MLEYLHIRNLALIEDMELEFAPGMNVLTGETGAGKSFILKALGFVLGDRLSADMVRSGADKARVEALFTLDGEELVIRRELLAESGRSRLYVNDSLRSQDAVRELRTQLLIHTSQHGQQQLLQPAFQARFMESVVPCRDLLEARDELMRRLRAEADALEELKEKRAELADKRDLLEMRQQEIDRVAPEEGEEERLEEQRARLRETAGLREQYEKAQSYLYGSEDMGLLDALGQFESLLRRIGAVEEDFMEEADAVAETRQRLSQLRSRLRRPPVQDDDIDVDALEERLYELAQLKRKLHRSMPEILAMREEIAENLSFLDACALDISAANRRIAALVEELKGIVERILPQRREAALQFTGRLEQELRGLGFSEEVRVIPEFLPQELWPGVADEKVRLLWAPNPGQPPHPLDRIASGGELSRFLLALIAVQPHAESATCIFDEVDAGVGGLTLNKLAAKLDDFSRTRQTLLITHWPQLAARGQKHFHVCKVVRQGQTYTLCAPLDAEGRSAELARMEGREA